LIKKIFLVAVFVSSINGAPIFNSIVSNKDTLGRYEKFEISINLTASFTNPFNKNEIHLRALFVSPSGKNFIIDGFYYQDYIRTGPPENLTQNGEPFWKIRFTPNETGNWSYQIICTDLNGTTTTGTRNFFCVPSDKKGFIRVANNRYLKFENGDQFFGIGLNMGWYDYPEKTFSYQRWIDSLSANNGNLIRVWMSENAFAIEWKNTGLGNYTNRLDRAYQLDWLLDYAEKKNVYVQLCLVPHGQFSINVDPEWNNNPYNSANGGPCPTPESFFTNEVAKNYFKRRLDYIIARWGYSPNLFAWEIFNEVDHTNNYDQNKQNVTQWLIEIAQYIKSKDVYGRIVTTSFANEFLEPLIWSNLFFDIIQLHHYNTTADMQTALVELTRLYLSDYNKPTAIGEYDFLELGYWASDNDPLGINFHNTLWASVMSGAYLTSMSWSWNNYIANKNLFYHFKSIANFLSNVNLLNKNFTPVSPQTFTTYKADFIVAPAYPLWGLSPANNFTVSHNGLINPNTINLSKFLYGTAFNTEYRNPPTFNVSYDEIAEFKVVVGNSMGASPRLQIWLNGIKRLDQIANTNVTYSITIPAGEHQIFVDNQGIDWMRIAEYVFTNFAVGLRCYALKSENEILGWVQNRNFNWRYVRDIGGFPQIITDGKIIFTNISQGSIYKVDWFDTKTSTFFLTDTVVSNSVTLEINVPPIQSDYAFIITKIGSTGIAGFTGSKFNFNLKQNFPNPFNSKTRIAFSLPEISKVNLKIYNSLGKEVKSLITNEIYNSGEYEIVFNSEELPSGVYFYKLQTEKFSQTRKMILLK
jgi:hypothetical protein